MGKETDQIQAQNKKAILVSKARKMEAKAGLQNG